MPSRMTADVGGVYARCGWCVRRCEVTGISVYHLTGKEQCRSLHPFICTSHNQVLADLIVALSPRFALIPITIQTDESEN